MLTNVFATIAFAWYLFVWLHFLIIWVICFLAASRQSRSEYNVCFGCKILDHSLV